MHYGDEYDFLPKVQNNSNPFCLETNHASTRVFVQHRGNKREFSRKKCVYCGKMEQEISQCFLKHGKGSNLRVYQSQN